MTYLIRHVTSFSYQPAVGESVMEVRLQPRSDTRQRCLTSTIDVTPAATVSVYRDFYGNAVHHFDIPGKHNSIEVISEATVDMLPRLDIETSSEAPGASSMNLSPTAITGKCCFPASSRGPRKCFFACSTNFISSVAAIRCLF